jgi:NADPH-dependent 2,4-dienoyl-CoA reductase/sulfur reductase-like enzyme
VTAIHPAEHRLDLDNSIPIGYDKLLLATGSARGGGDSNAKPGLVCIT